MQKDSAEARALEELETIGRLPLCPSPICLCAAYSGLTRMPDGLLDCVPVQRVRGSMHSKYRMPLAHGLSQGRQMLELSNRISLLIWTICEVHVHTNTCIDDSLLSWIRPRLYSNGPHKRVSQPQAASHETGSCMAPTGFSSPDDKTEKGSRVTWTSASEVVRSLPPLSPSSWDGSTI